MSAVGDRKVPADLNRPGGDGHDLPERVQDAARAAVRDAGGRGQSSPDTRFFKIGCARDERSLHLVRTSRTVGSPIVAMLKSIVESFLAYVDVRRRL